MTAQIKQNMKYLIGHRRALLGFSLAYTVFNNVAALVLSLLELPHAADLGIRFLASVLFAPMLCGVFNLILEADAHRTLVFDDFIKFYTTPHLLGRILLLGALQAGATSVFTLASQFLAAVTGAPAGGVQPLSPVYLALSAVLMLLSLLVDLFLGLGSFLLVLHPEDSFSDIFDTMWRTLCRNFGGLLLFHLAFLGWILISVLFSVLGSYSQQRADALVYLALLLGSYAYTAWLNLYFYGSKLLFLRQLLAADSAGEPGEIERFAGSEEADGCGGFSSFPCREPDSGSGGGGKTFQSPATDPSDSACCRTEQGEQPPRAPQEHDFND